MQTLGPIIRAQRKRLGLTLQRLADLVGCTKGYLSAIENNRRGRPPSPALLARIERVLCMTPDRLLSVGWWQAAPQELQRRVIDLESDCEAARRLARILATRGIDHAYQSGELRRLVERFEQREYARAGAGDGIERDVPWRAALPLQVPLINKVAAGYPTGFTDLGYPARVADEYVSVPDVNDPDAFAARVVGPSMEPLYLEGDIVVFSPLAPTPDGSDCFVRFDGPPETAESTFKRVYFEKGTDPPGGPDESGVPGSPADSGTSCGERIRLQPLNPAFAARIVPREAVAGLYAAVYVIRGVRGARG